MIPGAVVVDVELGGRMVVAFEVEGGRFTIATIAIMEMIKKMKETRMAMP